MSTTLWVYLAGVVANILLVYGMSDRSTRYSRSEAADLALFVGFVWPLVYVLCLIFGVVVLVVWLLTEATKLLLSIVFREGV